MLIYRLETLVRCHICVIYSWWRLLQRWRFKTHLQPFVFISFKLTARAAKQLIWHQKFRVNLGLSLMSGSHGESLLVIEHLRRVRLNNVSISTLEGLLLLSYGATLLSCLLYRLLKWAALGGSNLGCHDISSALSIDQHLSTVKLTSLSIIVFLDGVHLFAEKSKAILIRNLLRSSKLILLAFYVAARSITLYAMNRTFHRLILLLIWNGYLCSILVVIIICLVLIWSTLNWVKVAMLRLFTLREWFTAHEVSMCRLSCFIDRALNRVKLLAR